MGFFRLLNKDVSETVDVCLGPQTDETVFEHPYIKPFVRMVKMLVCDVKALEAADKEALMQKMRQANENVAQLLASKMERYRGEINMAMMDQQHKLRSLLVAAVQPLLDMLTDA